MSIIDQGKFREKNMNRFPGKYQIIVTAEEQYNPQFIVLGNQ